MNTLQATAPFALLLRPPRLVALAAAITELFLPQEAKGGIDQRTGLYNFEGLMGAADEMLARARAEGRPLSVVVIEFSDLREVHEIYGHKVSRKVIAKVVGKLRAVAGMRGLAGRTGTEQFTLVLPMRRDKALQAIQRVLGKPARIEFDAGDSEIVLVPDLVLDSTDAATESMQVVWQEMCQEMATTRKVELRRQHYLQRERERHSRPMALPSRL
ncbi:MAG: regulator protein domain-like protein [Ramlibacter sp.]|nr:regulator protein domain-like protein [Ramlibacter sp.]